MAQDRSTGIGEGIRTGIGVLTAFKEAIEETVDEAIERGEMSPERAKELMKETAGRIQASYDDARERLDFVSRRELEVLRVELEALRRRVDRLEAALVGGPEQNGHDRPEAGSGASIPVD